MSLMAGPGLGVEQLREAYRWARARAAVADALASCQVITVVAAHGGAGASTVALAVAEVLASTRPARLLDVTEPVRSGLTCASTAELGPDGTGWLLGRRGDLQIDRRDPGTACSRVLPVPRAAEPGQVVVIDQGTQSLGDWELVARRRGRLVVVAAATMPGLEAADRLLEHQRGAALVLVSGLRRARPRLRGDGPGVRHDGVVAIPYLRRLSGSGVGVDPPDRRLVATGARVLHLLGLAPAAGDGGHDLAGGLEGDDS